MITLVYFVRHAEPEHDNPDDRNRPLTTQGMIDSSIVLDTLQNKRIDSFYCSPYKRSLQTILPAAQAFHKEIVIDERLRERQAGNNSITANLLGKRWDDHDFHEPNGESIAMVQERNIAALQEILKTNEGKSLVIGTHGTALSTIINHYQPSFGYDDFLRIMDWMPYIVMMQFEGERFLGMQELAHVKRPFTASVNAKVCRSTG